MLFGTLLGCVGTPFPNGRCTPRTYVKSCRRGRFSGSQTCNLNADCSTSCGECMLDSGTQSPDEVASSQRG